ncbi:Homeodomain-like protein, partial [Athelia psychrophila]
MDATTQGPPAKLARTTSAMSTSSEGSSSFVNESGAGQVYRRTRTRFTHQQLSMLERLYARTSHPTREDRDALARAAGMETKHITIWFQNKRQNERKMALQGGKPLTVTSAQPLPGAPRHLLYNNTLASPYHPLPLSSLSAHSSAHS